MNIVEEDAWGTILADAARHISMALRDAYQPDQKAALREIQKRVNREIEKPTSEAVGELLSEEVGPNSPLN